MKSLYYKQLIQRCQNEKKRKELRESIANLDHKKIKDKRGEMTKSEFIKDLNKLTGETIFISDANLAEYFHLEDSDNLKLYLCDLERVSGKYFFIPDVAGSIKAKAEVYMG